MERRIVSIICIMFLLFAITSPISGSIFSYADEPQQEQLSQDEVIKAAIALYLNERKAWITATTSAPVEAVQAQMQIWIDSYDFWTNHTTIGSAAAFYAQCIVKYNPFRISLKGPAVRALNDLYNWLIDSGKLPNLEADDHGGQTTDNIYDGLIKSGYIYFTYSQDVSSSTNNISMDLNYLKRGISVDLWDSNRMLNQYKILNPDANFDENIYQSDLQDLQITVNWAADISNTYTVRRVSETSGTYANYSPGLIIVQNWGYDNSRFMYSRRVNITNGGPIYLLTHDSSGVNKFRYGFISIVENTGRAYFTTLGTFSSSNKGEPVSINFDTDNFNKTDPTPPAGDNEVTYTPEDKTTGNTYNTYNEYITNYVTKNTVINNNYQEPDEPEQPGGTTPPWDGGDTTVTPDGDGFNLNLPDLTLPDLNIDWNLRGLSEKFPFSIPWDLMAFFTVLNAEPETPAIEAQIDLGIVDWDIDWDLHNFDTLAALLRNLEFIGFCLALILITRSIIKG